MARTPTGSGARTWQQPAFAATLAVIALLVFTWPLVLDPPPTFGEAFAHLFGAWAVVVFAAWRLSSALRVESEGSGDHARE